MFTGLVETLGTVCRVEAAGSGRRLTVAAPTIAGALAIGESVSVNGACLTVVAQGGETCAFEAGPETLRRTNLGSLAVGERVNLERALRARQKDATAV